MQSTEFATPRVSAARGRRVATPSLRWLAALLGLAVVATGCASGPKRHALDYPPAEFREAIHELAPDLADDRTHAPFEVDRAIVARARKRIESVPLGPPRIEALVAFMMEPEPKGLGLVYDWSVSVPAKRAIELRRGNCLALANVLVGLGRGIGWPVFYAEARPRKLETQQFEEVRALSDHMVTVILSKTVKMIVDFTGLVKEGYDIRPIDDLTAYAHLVNNVAGQRVMKEAETASEADWDAAREGFELATRIQPELGRAWNNLGIVYRRLGRIDDARDAYHRALGLDAGFGSARHNLSLMETRGQGVPSVMRSGSAQP